jgi:hypothetical protein
VEVTLPLASLAVSLIKKFPSVVGAVPEKFKVEELKLIQSGRDEPSERLAL